LCYIGEINMFTIPNLLTFIRFIIVPFYFYFLVSNRYMTAAVLYGLAAVSDILDGYLARRLNQGSELGKIIDPIADKLIVGVTLIFFSFKRIFPPVLVIIFVLKELLMLLVGLWFLLKGIKIISSRMYGKIAMVLTSISILMALLQIPLSVSVFAIGLFFSIFAGLDYLNYYLKVLRK